MRLCVQATCAPGYALRLCGQPAVVANPFPTPQPDPPTSSYGLLNQVTAVDGGQIIVRGLILYNFSAPGAPAAADAGPAPPLRAAAGGAVAFRDVTLYTRQSIGSLAQQTGWWRLAKPALCDATGRLGSNPTFDAPQAYVLPQLSSTRYNVRCAVYPASGAVCRVA